MRASSELQSDGLKLRPDGPIACSGLLWHAHVAPGVARVWAGQDRGTPSDGLPGFLATDDGDIAMGAVKAYRSLLHIPGEEEVLKRQIGILHFCILLPIRSATECLNIAIGPSGVLARTSGQTLEPLVAFFISKTFVLTYAPAPKISRTHKPGHASTFPSGRHIRRP